LNPGPIRQVGLIVLVLLLVLIIEGKPTSLVFEDEDENEDEMENLRRLKTENLPSLLFYSAWAS
jgi:hypothetical protein